MPFMLGRSPVRRTLDHLESGTIVLRKQVQVMSIGYSLDNERSRGTRDFLFWHWAQMQYKNPNVQLIKWPNLAPNPFVQVFLDDSKEVLVDLDYMQRQQIHERLQRIFGKTSIVLQKEAAETELGQSPANFGSDCARHCMCEVQGQQPCTATVPAPRYMQGTWRWNKNV